MLSVQNWLIKSHARLLFRLLCVLSFRSLVYRVGFKNLIKPINQFSFKAISCSFYLRLHNFNNAGFTFVRFKPLHQFFKGRKKHESKNMLQSVYDSQPCSLKFALLTSRDEKFQVHRNFNSLISNFSSVVFLNLQTFFPFR